MLNGQEGKKQTNESIIKIISGRIHENLDSYYPEIGGANASISGMPLGGPYAQTFKFDISSSKGNQTVFAKICPIFGSLNAAKLEFETLKLLYPRISEVSPSCAVARPLDFFTDLNAYLMESVGMHNLKTFLLQNNSIFSNGSSRGNLLTALEGAARWLKAFHTLTRTENPLAFNSESFIKSIYDDFDYHLMKGFSFNKKTIHELFRLMDRLPILDGKLHMSCAKWHWDYTPGHVYLDGNKISVIDIAGLDNAPIYEDIGHFLAAMTVTNNLPFYPLFNRRRAGGELCDHFLQSYMDADLERDEFLLLVNIYAVKYFILYFYGQYTRVSEKIHPVAGKAFANLRSARLIEQPLLRAINEVDHRMRNFL